MPHVESNPLKVDENVSLPCTEINGQDLKKYFYAGLTWLKTNQPLVNSLNVFPVPDVTPVPICF